MGLVSPSADDLYCDQSIVVHKPVLVLLQLLVSATLHINANAQSRTMMTQSDHITRKPCLAPLWFGL